MIYTDGAQVLTRGDPTGPLAFLTRLSPAVEIYTCVHHPEDEDGTALIGQVQYTAGDRSARIVFLMPEDGINQPGLADLLENMAVQAAGWGAYHLLAEVEENSCAMDGLRRAGFSVYAWQRIWKYKPTGNGSSSNGNGKNGDMLWQPATSVDEVMIRNLYQSVVPPLVQSAEPLSSRRLTGWVFRQEGEILAYVEGFYGPQGIYLQPIIHPGVENINEMMGNLLAQQRPGKPIYLAIRSYQAWLETVVRDLECQVGPRQALMVKHLVVQQRVAVQATRHSVLEKYTAEPTVPLINNSTVHK